jgi:hypothetical protein
VPGMEPKNVKFARIGPAYFETFGIPTLAGQSRPLNLCCARASGLPADHVVDPDRRER